MKPVALVGNAADSKQVRNAGRKERDRRGQELSDLSAVLATPAGRRVLWRLLGECRVFETPTHTRGDMTHQNIGRGDVGRFLIAEINEASDDAWLTMQQEARAVTKREHVEAEATRTTSASQTGGNDDE